MKLGPNCILLNKSVFSINSLILLYYLSIIHYHIYEINKELINVDSEENCKIGSNKTEIIIRL